MIILIDNYDSFSYNLYQSMAGRGYEVQVLRNDELSVPELYALEPERIVLSPGPGRPHAAGICEALVRGCPPEIPLLGVCLGHQAICEAFGGKIIYAPRLMHGKSSLIHLEESALFAGLAHEIMVGRYHSLAVERDSLPSVLRETAVGEDGVLMAVEHRNQPIFGLQFHPESILTAVGQAIIDQFCQYDYRSKQAQA